MDGEVGGLRPFRVSDYIKSEEDLTEYRRAIIEGVEEEIAALRKEVEALRAEMARATK